MIVCIGLNNKFIAILSSNKIISIYIINRFSYRQMIIKYAIENIYPTSKWIYLQTLAESKN